MASQISTVTDVAEAAGVSVATASLALRDDARVAAKTKRRVKLIADRLNYRPQAFARALRGGRTHAIGLVSSIPEQQVPFSTVVAGYAEAIAEIADVLAEKNYHLAFGGRPGLGEVEREPTLPRLFAESWVEGLIVLQSADHELLSAIDQQCVPYVVLDGPPQQGMFSVCVHPQQAAEHATKHLLSLGHRDIALLSALWPDRNIASPHSSFRQDAYQNGYVRAMSNASCLPMPGWDAPLRLSEHVAQLFAGGTTPTALVVYDTINALSLMVQLQKLGLRIPEDVSIVVLHEGMDAALVCASDEIGLTCIAPRQRQMARLAVDALLQLIDHPQEPIKPIILTPKIKTGQTAGLPPR